MSKSRKWTLGAVVLGVAGAALYGVVTANGSSNAIDPSRLAAVESGPMVRSVVATGKIEPITKVEIKSKASGIVKKLYVDASDQVKTGQLLAELDKEEIQARVSQSEAALQAAKANVERAKVGALGPDVPLLLRAYERAQQMAKEGVVSQAALDDAQRAYELAVNKQNMAKASLAQAKAQVHQSQATLEQLQQEYRNSTIVAPMDGLVLSRDVEVGDAVSSILVLGSSATLIMNLGDTSEVYVKGKVDESDIAKVYLGQPARIKVESFKDKTFNGKVTKISPLGVEKDNVTTFEVRVSVTNDKGELKAAMTANAEIILEEHKGTLIIPEGALLYDKDKNASVEVPDPHGKDGKRKVTVKVGVSNGAKTEVLSGLKEGDQVIVQ